MHAPELQAPLEGEGSSSSASSVVLEEFCSSIIIHDPSAAGSGEQPSAVQPEPLAQVPPTIVGFNGSGGCLGDWDGGVDGVSFLGATEL